MQTIRQRIGRVEMVLEWGVIGGDYMVALTGGREHIGAVAVATFDEKSRRATSSVISVPGHREEGVALEGARRISQATGRTAVLTVGIHLDNITKDEISQIMAASGRIIDMFMDSLERT